MASFSGGTPMDSLMGSLAWWNRWRTALSRAKQAKFKEEQEIYCRAAMIAYAEFEMLQAQYWQNARTI